LWCIFTDGSNSEQGVGLGVAVFTGKVLTELTCKFKLDNRCSNNQAELANVKALEVTEKQQVNNNEHRKAVIYMDSNITLDKIRSAKNHNHLVDEIRKPAVALSKKEVENRIYMGES
jgi:ribonuclease HI